MTPNTGLDLLIGGTLVPFVISVINQTHRWSSQVRGSVAFAVCLLAAVALARLHGELTPAGWEASAVAVTGAAVVMYREIWKPSGLAGLVESTTNLGPGREEITSTGDSSANGTTAVASPGETT